MAANTFLVLAQSAGGPGSILIFVAMFAVMYLLIFRPQQKQMKEHQALVKSVKKGDEVITQGGIVGRIFEVKGRTVQLEIASGVKIRVLTNSIQGRWAEEPAKDAAKADEAKPAEADKKEAK